MSLEIVGWVEARNPTFPEIDPVVVGFRFGSTQPTDLWYAVRSQLGSIDDVKIVMLLI